MSRRTGNNYSGARWLFSSRPKHVVDGPEPPEYMRGKGTLAASVRRIWLFNNNPHRYFHEEVRLAKARLSRMRRTYLDNSVYVREAVQSLADAERGLADFEAGR
jgi:hypothetical protein